MPSMVGVDPTQAQHNDHSEALFTVGETYEKMCDNTLCVFQYIRVEDADLVAGDPVYPASADGTEVTRDVSGGSRITNKAQGIAINAITDGNYGFIQVAGVGQVALTLNSGDFSAGDSIMGDTSNDGKVAGGTLGTDDGQWIGHALAASSSSVLSAGAYILHGNL